MLEIEIDVGMWERGEKEDYCFFSLDGDVVKGMGREVRCWILF